MYSGFRIGILCPFYICHVAVHKSVRNREDMLFQGVKTSAIYVGENSLQQII